MKENLLQTEWMDYHDFTNQLRKYLEDEFRKPVSIQTLQKIEGTKDALIINLGKYNPTIYPEAWYQYYDEN